jgi:hypothetical protein
VITEIYDLSCSSPDARNILVQVVINHLHNPGKGFSNCDMARQLVHGTTQPVSAGCPNAFGVVVSGDYVFVAYRAD